MTKIIIITTPEGSKLYYTSILALLRDPANPISITQRRWSQIVKEKGYPFQIAGCTVQIEYAKGTADVRN